MRIRTAEIIAALFGGIFVGTKIFRIRKNLGFTWPAVHDSDASVPPAKPKKRAFGAFFFALKK